MIHITLDGSPQIPTWVIIDHIVCFAAIIKDENTMTFYPKANTVIQLSAGGNIHVLETESQIHAAIDSWLYNKVKG